MNINTSKLNSILKDLDSKLKEETKKPHLNIAIETPTNNYNQEYDYVVIDSFNNGEKINEKFKNGKGKFLILLHPIRDEDFNMIEANYEKVYSISETDNINYVNIPSDNRTKSFLYQSIYEDIGFGNYDFYDYMVYKLVFNSFSENVSNNSPLPYGSILIDENKEEIIMEKTNCYSKEMPDELRSKCHSETLASESLSKKKDASKYNITFLTTYIPCDDCMDSIINSIVINNLHISKIQYIINEKESNLIGNHKRKLKRINKTIEFSMIKNNAFTKRLLQYSSKYIDVCKSFIK